MCLRAGHPSKFCPQQAAEALRDGGGGSEEAEKQLERAAILEKRRKVMEEWSRKLKRSGYPATFRHQVVKRLQWECSGRRCARMKMKE